MRATGHLLVGAGTVGGVVSAAPTPESPIGFTLSFLCLAAGLILSRRQAGAPGLETVRPEPSALADLERALTEVRRLSETASALSLVELRAALDRLATGPLFTIAATLGHTRSGDADAAAFAADLAIAERRLNRCWSATVDGARAEVQAVLPEAVAALETARARLVQEGRPAKS